MPSPDMKNIKPRAAGKGEKLAQGVLHKDRSAHLHRMAKASAIACPDCTCFGEKIELLEASQEKSREKWSKWRCKVCSSTFEDNAF